jgi:putative two-component system response regulator
MGTEAVDNSKRILVVDDDPAMLLSLEQRLKSWGYAVQTARSGEEALKLVSQQTPHLMLLDIMLPRMKGRELCAKLKEDPQTARMPVIFLSALGLPDHIRAGMNLGAEDYLVKPFDPADLKQRIEVCLSRHNPQP